MDDKVGRVLAIVSLVAGIASIALAFFVPFLCVLCAAVGVMLGTRTRKTDSRGRAGLICSLVGLALYAFVVVVALLYAFRTT